MTSSSGYDTAFTQSDGTTTLSFEIESYTASTGQYIAWVKIPTLSHSVNTKFYLYYGNSKVTTNPSSTSTWDSNYLGVWHLPNRTTLTANDSTSNANNGTPDASTTATAGEIDGGAGFNGVSGDTSSSSAIGVGTTLDNSTTNPITLEAWVNTTTLTQAQNPIFYHADGPGRLHNVGC